MQLHTTSLWTCVASLTVLCGCVENCCNCHLCSAAKCPWALVCAATPVDQYPEQSYPELQSVVLFAQGPV